MQGKKNGGDNMPAVKPSAQAKNVYELFAGKVFRVPDCQRNYTWENKNLEDFWNDIKEGLSTNTEHYWGTITLKVAEESLYCEEKTTIYLFLLALSNVKNQQFEIILSNVETFIDLN